MLEHKGGGGLSMVSVNIHVSWQAHTLTHIQTHYNMNYVNAGKLINLFLFRHKSDAGRASSCFRLLLIFIF